MKAKKQETKNVNLNNVKKLSSLELSQIKGGTNGQSESTTGFGSGTIVSPFFSL